MRWLVYSVDEHRPPRAAASARIPSIVPGKLCAQVGHQLRLRTLPTVATHSCPSAHCQRRRLLTLTYVSERHRPPRAAAVASMSSSVNGVVEDVA